MDIRVITLNTFCMIMFQIRPIWKTILLLNASSTTRKLNKIVRLFSIKTKLLIVSYKKYEKKPLKCLNSSHFLDPLANNALRSLTLHIASCCGNPVS